MENRSKSFAEATPQIDGILSQSAFRESRPRNRTAPGGRLQFVPGRVDHPAHAHPSTVSSSAPVISMQEPWPGSTEPATTGRVVGSDSDPCPPGVDRRHAGDPATSIASSRGSRSVCRVGCAGIAPLVQVLALARTPLFEQVADGRFSPELYYRLNTVMVEVRGPDLPL